MNKNSFRRFRLTNSRTGEKIEIGVDNPTFILQEITGLSGLSSSIGSYKNVFQDGETFKRQSMNSRNITITLVINNPTGDLETLENYKKSLRNILLPRDEIQLLNLSSYYYINCYIENTPEFNYNNKLSRLMLECTIYLRAFNPFWYNYALTSRSFMNSQGINGISVFGTNEGVETPYSIVIDVLKDITEILILWIKNIESGTSTTVLSLYINTALEAGAQVTLSVSDSDITLIKTKGINSGQNLIQYLDANSQIFLLPHNSFFDELSYEARIFTIPTYNASSNETVKAKIEYRQRQFDI